ncbi:MAG: hypothetical protein K0R90_1819, partial [Oscillospiraceae bacterium]|nr:hypothetical protein [Oscillospiraceae bacterium]
MTSFVKSPNLPCGEVNLVAVSAENSNVIKKLHKLKIKTIQVQGCEFLDTPVRAHADMIIHHLGGRELVVLKSERDLIEKLENEYGFCCHASVSDIGRKYPMDISLNACRIGNFIFCKQQVLDEVIKDYLIKHEIEIVNVNQGYTKCSACIVDEKSVVTSDIGIANAMEKKGIDVLLIDPRGILLEGYDTGFIGGCCGKLDKDTILFTGDLSSHKDSLLIRKFITSKGIEILECENQALVDIGGIL